ncbi:lipopolysaccharide assembly protein LapB [uncultured Methanomethylovorans sp.]|uniref:tetratricopeptide repeat protein n=1 Tax=uncultured Methanomethylovorans sp. TaxID=183759 RepID=UPI00261B8368|nr:tetratricopeptide repeat protein [uncultured Methanomethylovorans sp.]
MFKELDNYLKNSYKVTILLQNGDLIKGSIEVYGDDYIILKNETHVYGIAHRMIGMWEVETSSSPQIQDAASDTVPEKNDDLNRSDQDELLEHISAMQEINTILGSLKENGLELKHIKIEFPSGVGTEGVQDDKKKWNRINDQYRSSLKNNNLSQLSFLASELSELAQKYPQHGAFNYKAGMFYSLVNGHEKAACEFKNAFLKEPKPEFIYNAACEAFRADINEEVYFDLGLYFNVVSPWNDMISWKQFCLSAISTGNYYIFKKVMLAAFSSFENDFQDSDKEKYELMIGSLMLVLVENKMHKKALKLKALLGIRSFKDFSVIDLLESMLESLPLKPDPGYDNNINILNEMLRPKDIIAIGTNETQTYETELTFKEPGLKCGNIYSYKSDRGFGFLRDTDGIERYFYYMDIPDDELKSQVNTVQWGNEINVLFEPSTGSEGQYTACNIFPYKIMDNIIDLAEAFYKEGSLPNAIFEINEALSIDPDNHRCKELCKKWEDKSNSGKMNDKKQVVNIQPKSGEEWYEKACLLLKLKQYEEAIQAFDKSKSPGSDPSAKLYGKGIAYLNSHRYEDAIDCLEKAIAIIPVNYRALFALSSAYLRAGNLERSIEHSNKATSLRPDIPQYRMNTANALFLLEEYEGSIDYLNKVILLDPKNYVAWSWKGAAHLKNNQPKEANYSIEQALSINPMHADSLFCKGYILSKEHRCEEALQYFDQALKLDPTNVKALTKRGFVLSYLSRHKEALESIEKAISLNWGNSKSWYYKGIAYLNAGEYEKAVEAFNTSLEIRPDVARVMRSRSCVLSKLGNGSDAKVVETETNGVDTILYDDLIDTYECEIKIAD